MGSEGGQGSGGDVDRRRGPVAALGERRGGLVAWDTLRDRESGRLQLTYGDALNIDATQGLTSTSTSRRCRPTRGPSMRSRRTPRAAGTSRRPSSSFRKARSGRDRRAKADQRFAADPRGRRLGQHSAQPSASAVEAERARLPFAQITMCMLHAFGTPGQAAPIRALNGPGFSALYLQPGPSPPRALRDLRRVQRVRAPARPVPGRPRVKSP
jgi:hypothetical protein